jgi:hypothetical protein
MIVIVDYGLGNIGSIVNMLKKIDVVAILSADPTVIQTVDKLILPGVGAFDSGMRNLTERGLVPLLNWRVLEDKVPILGLCQGMQLFTKRSEEGQLPGLGWLDAETVRFKFDGDNVHLKIPHDPALQEEDTAYVIKKLGLTDETFEQLLKSPKKSFWDYPSYARLGQNRVYRALWTVYRALKMAIGLRQHLSA